MVGCLGAVVLAEAKQAMVQVGALVFVVERAVVVVGIVVIVAAALDFAVEAVSRNDPQRGNVAKNIRYRHLRAALGNW